MLRNILSWSLYPQALLAYTHPALPGTFSLNFDIATHHHAAQHSEMWCFDHWYLVDPGDTAAPRILQFLEIANDSPWKMLPKDSSSLGDSPRSGLLAICSNHSRTRSLTSRDRLRTPEHPEGIETSCAKSACPVSPARLKSPAVPTPRWPGASSQPLSGKVHLPLGTGGRVNSVFRRK